MARRLDPASLGDHLDRLFRAAWALSGSREEAEDLVQDTYVRVLSRPRFLRHDDDLGYLLKVLRNTFLTSRRTASRRPRTVPIPEERDVFESSTPTPVQALESREVFAAISTLNPDFRDVLVAIDVAGLSYAETAKAFGVPEGTVMSRLYRARKRVTDAYPS